MTRPSWRDSLRSGAAAWTLMLALSIIAGAWLRWDQLGVQVLLDDEWHAVHKVLNSDAADIATTFGFADHSIPLTLYYRLLALHGGLTEWVMRLPMLLSGIGLLLVVPPLLRRETTLPVRAAWVALLAISPLLVYHSKTARPYALTSLLTFIAIVAFRRWWLREGATKGWGAAYIAATLLAGWLHPITLPFTLLPFLYYGLREVLAWRRTVAGTNDRTGLRRQILFGIGTAIPLAAVLLPPLLNDWVRFWGKAGTHSVTPESVYRTLLMLFGIAQPALLVLLVVLIRLEDRRIARAGASGQTPVKDILGGLVLGLLGAGLIAGQDTAAIIGWIVVMFCLVAMVKGILRLIVAGLRWRLFRKRTGPEELEPIQDGERSAA